ncbi:glycosyltransferase [Thermoanaerobacterium sp. RBIITD]|uniref:glycosyltransferase n=1 Tax=Thermoanaerobacterium sp. RBIITD TaxID=1550240 RepID=UPI000BB7D3F3|nr:glycosyltransferase [Thermoanaerobacterium sp. RBIITD]SNX53834.1 hypothetical protein SAMN05660242_1444 [Thermoanaerobacterium sp. RBIITD]
MATNKLFQYIFTLTDDTGIMQHSIGSIPDPNHGYTTDDNSRAIIAATMLYEKYKDEKYLKLIIKYVSFLLYAQSNNGYFRNFMNYNRTFKDESISEDCFGRCLWAASYLLKAAIPDNIKTAAILMIDRALKNINDLCYIRGKAYTLIGLYYIYKYGTIWNKEQVLKYINKLVNDILNEYEIHSSSDWKWYEDIISYDNGIIPLSLLKSYSIIENRKILDVAIESLDFLDSICFRHGYFKAIGCNGWYKKGHEVAEYDEQPVEAYGMALMYLEAYKIINNEKYKKRAIDCNEWYYGKNSKGISLYDDISGGCYDAITKNGVNLNQGAESITSIIISHCVTI